jgi:Calcineurin-like phosphoesterase
MPTPDRLISILKRTIDLTKSTPGRVGHLVYLQNCDDVVVVGDLHGHVPNFQAVWKIADLANHPKRHLVFQELIHGKFPYPSGGEKSHQVVDLVCVAKNQFPDRVHYLPGNHEMGQWTGRKILKGDDDLNEKFRVGVLLAYGEAAMPEIYRLYLELFQSCPLALMTPNHVFISHTSIPARHLGSFLVSQLEKDSYVEKDLQPGGVVYSILWGRDTSPESTAAFLQKVGGELLVTGHIPAEEGFTVPNPQQITLDCSATPGGYVLFPTDRPITHAELVDCIRLV